MLLAKLNVLNNFGRGHHEEHFCDIILNLDQWFRRDVVNCHFSSRALVTPSFIGAETFMQFW